MVSGELTVTGVGIRQYRAVGIGCSLGSALLPGEIPPGAVVVACGVARRGIPHPVVWKLVIMPE